jgi:hypothetical protein
MKRLFIALILSGICSVIFAYQNNMPNLVTPSIFTPGQMEFEIIHRFHDNLPNVPKYGFLVSGADIRLGYSGCVWDHLLLYGTYANAQTEFQFGARYSILPEDFFLRGALDVSYFNYEPLFNTPRKQSVFFLGSIQTVRIAKIFTFNANLGYDNFNKAFGGALGIDAKILPALFLYAEYGQNMAGPADNPEIKKQGFAAFGFKIETMGHHFMFVVQNDTQEGMRRMMLGTQTSYTNWYFGFTIQRLFDLSAQQGVE